MASLRLSVIIYLEKKRFTIVIIRQAPSLSVGAAQPTFFRCLRFVPNLTNFCGRHSALIEKSSDHRRRKFVGKGHSKENLAPLNLSCEELETLRFVPPEMSGCCPGLSPIVLMLLDSIHRTRLPSMDQFANRTGQCDVAKTFHKLSVLERDWRMQHLG